MICPSLDILPVSPTIPAMADGSGIDSHIYLRGDHRLSGGVAPRGFLTAIEIPEQVMPSNSSGRRQLAAAGPPARRLSRASFRVPDAHSR